ncbi:MAG: hypothetical protein HND44_23740 [Chloroflexi bacterium]|nr:hypothetical protein [Chloroflexota bacterium]NOG37554.1 hypothetical protein [Chloroflexota bacterium]
MGNRTAYTTTVTTTTVLTYRYDAANYARGGRVLLEEGGAFSDSKHYLYGLECIAELVDADELESEWRYYHQDGNHLVRQTTNMAATVTLAWTYSPEGMVLLGEEGPVTHLGCEGNTTYDFSTGLIFKNGRYFDPNTGIWITLSGMVVYHAWSPQQDKRRNGRRTNRKWLWLCLCLLLISLLLSGCGSGSSTPPTETPCPEDEYIPTLSLLSAEYSDVYLQQYNNQWRVDLGIPAFLEDTGHNPTPGISIRARIDPGMQFAQVPYLGTMEFIQDIEGKRYRTGSGVVNEPDHNVPPGSINPDRWNDGGVPYKWADNSEISSDPTTIYWLRDTPGIGLDDRYDEYRVDETFGAS